MAVPRKNYHVLDLMAGLSFMASSVILELTQTHCWKKWLLEGKFNLLTAKIPAPPKKSHELALLLFWRKWLLLHIAEYVMGITCEQAGLQVLLGTNLALVLAFWRSSSNNACERWTWMHWFHSQNNPVLMMCHWWSVVSCACLSDTSTYIACNSTSSQTALLVPLCFTGSQ